MEILIALIPLGLLMLGIAIAAFVWAVRHDQFDDLEAEGKRILMDDLNRPPSAAREAPRTEAESEGER